MIRLSPTFESLRAVLLLAVCVYTVGVVVHPWVHAAEYEVVVADAEQAGTTPPLPEADSQECMLLCQSVLSMVPALGALSFGEPESNVIPGLTASTPLWASRTFGPTLPRDPPLG